MIEVGSLVQWRDGDTRVYKVTWKGVLIGTHVECVGILPVGEAWRTIPRQVPIQHVVEAGPPDLEDFPAAPI